MVGLLPKFHFLYLKFTGNFVHPLDICNFAKNMALKQWLASGLALQIQALLKTHL